MRVFDGMRVEIHAHQADDIQTAIRIANEFHLRFSIEHCTDGYLIVDELVEKSCSMPSRSYRRRKGKIEARNKTFKAGQILENAGITFGLITDAPFVPIEGSASAGCSLCQERTFLEMALKCLTINNAIITDIDSRVRQSGTRKDADVVIWDVEPLATLSQVGIVIIDGQIAYRRKAGESNAGLSETVI